MTSLEKWDSLNPRLHVDLENIITEKLKFLFLMPVQKAVIPQFISHKDVVVEAVTGSGKTLSFLLPIFDYCIKSNLNSKTKIHSLVISPTRELAQQSYQTSKLINEGLNTRFSVSLLVGGQKSTENTIGNIVFGTPGRLKELTENSFLDLSELEILILDEADRMMSHEYMEDILFLIHHMPKQRRNGLFSATMSWLSTELIKKLGLRYPIKIEVNTGSGILPNSLQCCSVIVDNREEKIPLIDHLINKYNPKKCILFFNTCAGADFYGRLIVSSKYFSNYQIFILHGKMKQKKRVKSLEKFSKAKNAILFTTDVSSRGIDFPDINLIIQVDPPQEPANFVHRAGRTARVGKVGKAILLLEKHENPFTEYLKQQSIIFEVLDETVDPKKEIKFMEAMRNEMLKDRALIEKSKSAFVTFLRSYKEHKVENH